MKRNAVDTVNFSTKQKERITLEKYWVARKGQKQSAPDDDSEAACSAQKQRFTQPENSRLAPHSSTPCHTVGAALPFFLMDPREHFQFNKRQLDFSSKKLPLGANHNGTRESRTQNYVCPQGKVTSSRRKKKGGVLLMEAEFCLC